MNKQPLRLAAVAILAVATSFGFLASAVGEDAGSLKIVKGKTTLSISDGDRLVFRYRYAGVPMKPYVDQLFSPNRVQILRDAPPDHNHHHGLMFALKVDDVNFWEERDANSGKELHKRFCDVKATVNDDASRAGFVQKLDWVGPDSDEPLLIERREIDVVKANDLGATLIEWRSTLKTPPGNESMTLSGRNYFGLGMRFVESMDQDGRFFSLGDKPGGIDQGNQQLTPAKWCAYTAKADGKPVTVALFDHPDNLGHPAAMFTMYRSFSYLTATVDGWKQPVVVKAGHPLEFRYTIALWDGAADKATVERLYQRWCGLSP